LSPSSGRFGVIIYFLLILGESVVVRHVWNWIGYVTLLFVHNNNNNNNNNNNKENMTTLLSFLTNKF